MTYNVFSGTLNPTQFLGCFLSAVFSHLTACEERRSSAGYRCRCCGVVVWMII